MSGEPTTLVGDADLAHATEDETKELEKELGLKTDTGDGGGGDDDDDRTGRAEHDDDDGDDSGTPEEREQRRSRNQRARQRKKDKNSEIQRQLAGVVEQNRRMAEELAVLKNSDASSKLAQLDAGITEAANLYAQAQAVHTDAVAKADGKRATDAMDYMAKARDRHTMLVTAKDSLVKAANRPAPADPEVSTRVQTFQAANPWYKGYGATDPDSSVLSAIDRSLAAEGWVPTTDAYWEELATRAKKYLPHRYQDLPPDSKNMHNGADSKTPRSPVGGAAGSKSNSTGGNSEEGGYRLAAEYVKAMKESGIWDDPERRKRVIAAYKAQDKARNT